MLINPIYLKWLTVLDYASSRMEESLPRILIKALPIWPIKLVCNNYKWKLDRRAEYMWFETYQNLCLVWNAISRKEQHSWQEI